MKRIVSAVLAAALLLCLCSCGTVKKIIKKLLPSRQDETSFETEPFEPVTDGGETVSPDLPEDAMPYYDTVARYAWMTLDGDKQALYRKVLEAALSYEAYVDLPDDGVASYVWECVFFDTPELFYLAEEAKVKNGRLTFTYAFDRKYAGSAAEQLDAAYSEFLKQAVDSSDTYDKVLNLYEYIINRTKYNSDADEDYEKYVYNEQVYRAVSAIGPLLDGRSICIGYARATQYLALRLGIQTFTVKGSGGGGPHYYSLVKFDDGYYYVDTTWGDPVGSDRSIDYLTYYYFGMTTEELLRSHEIRTHVPLPVCTGTACNYFIRSGLVAADAGEIARISFDNLAKGIDQTLLRVSDYSRLDDVYSELWDAIPAEAAARGIECPRFGMIRSVGSGVIGVVFK